MKIRRIVPDIVSTDAELCREFYADFLGLRQAMNLGWIATYVSPSNETAQITVARSAEEVSETRWGITIEVEDVELAYRAAVDRGYKIVYPLTDEPWGVRRFFVADPNGVVINIMRHLKPSEIPAH